MAWAAGISSLDTAGATRGRLLSFVIQVVIFVSLYCVN